MQLIMKLTYLQPTKERLDKFLTDNLPDLTRSQIKKVILAGRVQVNGKKPTVHEWLHGGDIVEVKLLSEPGQEQRHKTTLEPTVIFENDDYLIINKPSGLLVHPTEAQEPNTLVSWLITNYPEVKKFGDQSRPGLVHRLDKDVSGIMVLAKNEKTYQYLKDQFSQRLIEKHYMALVNGRVLNDEGTIDKNLDRDKKTGKMKAYSDVRRKEEGKEAITKYKVVTKFINYTLLDVQIITGRTHQIRAHLASIGHSIVGDNLYATKDVRKSKKQIIDRPFLHAFSISFTAPDGQPVNYQSALPNKLGALLTTIK